MSNLRTTIPQKSCYYPGEKPSITLYNMPLLVFKRENSSFCIYMKTSSCTEEFLARVDVWHKREEEPYRLILGKGITEDLFPYLSEFVNRVCEQHMKEQKILLEKIKKYFPEEAKEERE